MTAPHGVPSQETIDRMIAEVATANGRLEGIKGQIISLDRRLYGNGQPGDIQRLHGRLDALERRSTFFAGKLKGIGISIGAASGCVVLILKLLEIAHLIGVR